MGMFLNPNNNTFQMATNSQIYVDKTNMIRFTNSVLSSPQAYICNSRPRRFGKSITADMLSAYYSKGCNSKKLFSPYAIALDKKFETHLNQYDVIHFDLQWCLGQVKNSHDIINYIETTIIQELKESYPTINYDHLSLSATLSKINETLGNKFVIIIDEWDVIIRDQSHDTKLQNEYIDFLRILFKGSEPSKYIALAYLTGILPIKKVKTQSALNNFEEYTMLHSSPLSSYFGFTEKEVYDLCKKYHQNFNEVKKWYDGYLLQKEHIYNPKAVTSLLIRGEFQNYWSRTSSYEVIVPLIQMNFDGLKESIINMLAGSSIEIDTNSFQNDTISFIDKDDVLTYLIHLGYLGYNQEEQSAFIPNEEIRQEFKVALKRVKWSELIEFEIQSKNILEATLDLDTDLLANSIEKIHNDYASNIYYHDENSLSSVLTIAYISTLQYYFKPIRELPTGRGFADFVYIPKPRYIQDYPALLIELKWNEKATTAIDQIHNKKYPDSLKDYTKHILLVGITYNKKTKEHHCTIEELNKDS